nr:probable 6-phosphogluconolactonase 4, chloroplastic [Tanacetum cinerariifolium]
MAPPTVQIFESEEQVTVALAVYILHLSAQFIAEKGSFSVVLSSGPLIDTLRKLTEPPYNSSINWSKWSIFYMDERVVPLNNSYSNYKQTYDGFLSKSNVILLPPPQRITFTFPLINSASEIAIVVTGEDLADAVKVALWKHANDYYPLPVQKVAPEGNLTWFLDKEATSLLN